MDADRYFLKPGYVSREEPQYCFDAERQVTWQPEVYQLAAGLARAFGCTRIIDLGCGQARKLVVLHPEFEVIGIDIGKNIARCRKRYEFGTWIESDLESDDMPTGFDARDSIVVASDVIEHLRQPYRLLSHIAALLEQASLALISTPERDLTRGPDDLGPPQNPAHAREWNRDEFSRLLSHVGLKHVIGLTPSNDRRWPLRTILAIIQGSPLAAHQSPP